MKQLLLYQETDLCQVVNVASVTHRSPFRYPGGKTWLVPRIRQWLKSCKTRPAEFIEPFAGGGIVSLTVAAEELADHVTMIELDEQVAAVWKTILDGDALWLTKRITAFNLTLESLTNELQKEAHSVRDRAFQTILKNRTYHGGILASGSAPLKNGENGKGIMSRWYAKTLEKRILEILKLKDHLTFIEGDGFNIIRQNLNRKDIVFFIDPPYTLAGKRAGRRLYTHFNIDHQELFKLMSQFQGDFLMTYDNDDAVHELALQYEFDTELVSMKNTHHSKMTELLIGRNLAWTREGR